MGGTVLQLSGIWKSFGGVAALRGARLDVQAGEVHGLIGENGAGKSTLINIATGSLRPDAGEFRVASDPGLAPVTLNSPRDAADVGFSVVHQEADLFAQLSVAENMLLGRGLVRNRLGLVDWAGTYREAGRQVAAMGERFSVRQPAAGLSIARRMMAEIAAAVSANARVLFLDEPTSALTFNEIENLFAQVRRLRDAGVGIVYVSHRLEEVLALCDRVTIMRDGETVETLPADGLTVDRMVMGMVGRDVKEMFDKRRVPIGEVRFRTRGLTARDGAFHGVNLEVRSGEILGLYGFVGAGRSELAQAVFGLRDGVSGHIEVDGRRVRPRTPRAAMGHGIAYLPEDRLVQAVFGTHSLRTNASVAMLRRIARAGFVSEDKERGLARRVVESMNVRASSLAQPIGTLSGGNQQKVVFGRWGATSPGVLLLDEPTRGVDVGAKAEIHRLVCDMAEQGTAVLLISSELPEVMAMSDRVAVMSEGRVTGEFDPREVGDETITAAAVPRAADKTAPAAGKGAARSRGLGRVREFGLVAFILVLAGVAAFLKPAEFATVRNFLDVLANAALPGILAQGAILIICAGGIDISVGAMVGLVSAVAALAAKAGAPPALVLLMAMGLGCAFSMINGGISRAARIHPIIVTLAGFSIYRGFMLMVMGSSEIHGLPGSYRALADGNLLGIPKVCYYLLAVTLACHVLLRYTLAGRRILALGNSEHAARLIGISRNRVTLFVFACSGVFVGLTAVLNAGYYGNVQANTGLGMEMQAIAAAVIGGTNILGGRGSAVGGLLGAFLVALVYNMLVILEISSFWQEGFVGALILLAVTLDLLLQRLGGGAR